MITYKTQRSSRLSDRPWWIFWYSHRSRNFRVTVTHLIRKKVFTSFSVVSLQSHDTVITNRGSRNSYLSSPFQRCVVNAYEFRLHELRSHENSSTSSSADDELQKVTRCRECYYNLKALSCLLKLMLDKSLFFSKYHFFEPPNSLWRFFFNFFLYKDYLEQKNELFSFIVTFLTKFLFLIHSQVDEHEF